MKKAYLTYLLMAIFALSCNKKDDKNTNPGNNFTYSVSGIHNLTIAPGDSDSLQLQLRSTGGNAENLSVSVTGLPSGVLAAYSATTGTPDFNTNITFIVNGTAAAGTYALKVVIHGAQTGDKTFDVSLTVGGTSSNVYTVNGIHDVTIEQGQDDSLNVTVQHTGSLLETVTLSVWGLPAGVTADLNPSSGTPNYNATILFTDHYGVPGNYTIKIISHSPSTGDREYSFNLQVLTPANCGILGFFSQGTTGCGNQNYQYTDNVVNSTAAANRVIFQNFANMPYQVYADVNCANNTLTIPNQLLPNGIQVAGSGTFTSNTINVDFHHTSTTNITTYCNFTLIR